MVFRDEIGQGHQGLSASGEESQHLHYRDRGGEDSGVKEAEEEGRRARGERHGERSSPGSPRKTVLEGGGVIYCADCSVG